jgi:hypothetical protein
MLRIRSIAASTFPDDRMDFATSCCYKCLQVNFLVQEPEFVELLELCFILLFRRHVGSQSGTKPRLTSETAH